MQPTEQASVEEKDEFYDNVGQVMDKVPRHDVRLLLGDFNAEVGREVDALPRTVGRHSLDTETNDNGARLATMAVGARMVMVGTLFLHRDIHKVGFHQMDLQKTRSNTY